MNLITVDLRLHVIYCSAGAMISQNTLPEGLVARCLDVLRKLSPNERDLIRVVVEVVHELRDPDAEEEAISTVSPRRTI